MTVDYEVLAVRYGVWDSRRSESFYRYGAYGEPDGPHQMDYFFWIIRDSRRVILVDTGFDPEAVLRRPGRRCLVPPIAALEELGIEPGSVTDVVVTHFHYDHIGNVAQFPAARIVIQRRELEFWTGPYGPRRAVAASVERSEVDYLESALQAGKIKIEVIDGDADIAPGIVARLVGGHCPGQQVVVVERERPIVLASDSVHFYEEMERDMPFEVFTDIQDMYRTYDVLRDMQSQRGAVVVAGHDPEVMRRFPARSAGLGNVVRIA
jgi:glyoxylase-like metal-dependent hydrolase (beta-lactamase superfamily II)